VQEIAKPEEPEAAHGATRRDFLAGAGLSLASLLGEGAVPAGAQSVADPPAPAILPGTTAITLRVNGSEQRIHVEPRVTLLDALRERLQLTGTKKGCDHGQCGACTALVDGRRVLSCLTLALMHEGAQITTIEGLADAEKLHPMQAAFIEHDAFQCGYCTPGQIMSAVGLVAEGHATADGEIQELMSGNICRCGAYPNIVAAVREVLEAQHASV
jgi:xanthine dehydrogenase YagT iron-sulfur-binding subunit